MTYTPAPWITQDSGYGYIRIIDGKGGSIARANIRWEHGTAERDANAQLIAAAPDLLEKLKDLVKACKQEADTSIVSFLMVKSAEHTIEKATS